MQLIPRSKLLATRVMHTARTDTKRSTRAALLTLGIAAAPGLAVAKDNSCGYYVPPPNPGALEQIEQLAESHREEEAELIEHMVRTPQAVWFTGETPRAVKKSVRRTVNRARDKHTVPVLVAYNIPFRDCAQFSAGGATTKSEYKRWIAAFAAGIGSSEAVVILEPDGLGIIPFYSDINGTAEWCQPAEVEDPSTAATERFEMLNYAVDVLGALPKTKVYLDGTHSAWLGVGDIADRLVKGGVERAAGFYLNASNYHYTDNLVQYGTWVSSCIASGDYASCANQFWNGGPEGTQIADLLGAWSGVALNHFGVWSDESEDPTLNTSGVNARFSSAPETHFVIDTSRNGRGPWQPGSYPDPMDWCNPPGRGLGHLPTTETGHQLVDAYLWIKIPGESDGACTRGLGVAGETVDPEWGRIDPAAGAWFEEMALDLVTNVVR